MLSGGVEGTKTTEMICLSGSSKYGMVTEAQANQGYPLHLQMLPTISIMTSQESWLQTSQWVGQCDWLSNTAKTFGSNIF